MAAEHNMIRRKLIAAIMATSIAVLVLTCSVFISYEYVSFRRSLSRGLTTRAEIIAATATASLAFQNGADGAEVLSALRRDPQIRAACLYDKNGQIFALYRAGTFTPPSSPPKHRASCRFANGYAEMFQPIVHEKHWLGTLYIKADLSDLRERFRVYAMLVVLVVAGCLFVAFGLSNWLQKRISQPILNLMDTARQVSEDKDYSLRAQKVSHDEIGLLADSFNEMLGQIQHRDASLRKTEEEIRQLNADLEKRVEERTSALAEANKELESFSYSVSHDLRAPLRHIDGFLGLLKSALGSSIDAKSEHYLNTISESAKHMGRLIDDLLGFCRTSRMAMCVQPVSSDELVQATVADLAMETEGRAITWKIDALPQVHADPGLLRQVWANLVSNAVKYTRGREQAVIEIGTLPGSADEHIFFIRDNGAGFEMEYAGKLFGVFQRLHRNDQFEGTGIGLANVRRIVHRHRGRTWAEGKVDGGATFYFSLPNGDEESHHPANAQASGSVNGHNSRIGAVKDDHEGVVVTAETRAEVAEAA